MRGSWTPVSQTVLSLKTFMRTSRKPIWNVFFFFLTSSASSLRLARVGVGMYTRSVFIKACTQSRLKGKIMMNFTGVCDMQMLLICAFHCTFFLLFMLPICHPQHSQVSRCSMANVTWPFQPSFFQIQLRGQCRAFIYSHFRIWGGCTSARK